MNRPISCFRTAGAVLVTVRRTEEQGRYDACCEGCGWARTSREAARDAAGTADRGASHLEALEHDANAHALGCAEVPQHLWPADPGPDGR